MRRHQHGGNVYENKNMIDFSANINPLGMPKGVVLAAMDAVSHSVHYPEPENKQLIQAIVSYENKYLTDKDISCIEEEQVLCGNGAAELIFQICQAVKPEHAILLSPTFAEYAEALKSVDCQTQEMILSDNDDFCITDQTVQMLEKNILEAEHPFQLMFLCQPNNPTGQFIKKKQLMAILALAQKYQFYIVLDYCFQELLSLDLIEESREVFCQTRKNPYIIFLKAFTKSYAMPGLRLGYLICQDKQLTEKIRQFQQPWNISLPAQNAGLAALEEIDYLEKSRNYIENRKRELLCGLKELERKNKIVQIYGYAANFIFFKADKELAKRLKKEGILIRDCSNYSHLSEGYFRIAVRTEEQNRRLIQTIHRIIQ